MKSFTKSPTQIRIMLARGAAICLLAAAPAAAETWNRIEIIGVLGGNGVYGVDALGLGLYHSRYGLGIGTRALELRGETWDLPRKGRPDASAHAMIILLPIEARVVLASWEGSPFLTSNSAESANGRLELFGAYCPWARLGQLTEVQTGILGTPERTAVNGLVKATTLDWGLSYDAGNVWSVSAGRFEFQTREDAVYRTRRDGRWYAMARLYYGCTHGSTISSSPLNLFRDAGFKLCRLFGRCGIIED